MNYNETEQLDRLVDEVRRSPKYAQISLSFVRNIAAEELGRHGDFATTVKATRTRLHEMTGAFLAPKLNYTHWVKVFKEIPSSDSEALKDQSLAMMRLHASISERLPFLGNFYQTCLASIAPVSSVLDLACGLNPLAIPWMPLTPNFTYSACDVILPMLEFLNQYFISQKINGKAFECDLTRTIPTQKAQVALLMKTLRLLERMDKSTATELLDGINADHILVSYPVKSLGGKSKGMAETYTEQFYRLIEGKAFSVQSFAFPTEIAFLLSRSN
ncbi:MAG: hypothetical protein WA116_01530 [Anaerolineaceae bacterium]